MHKPLLNALACGALGLISAAAFGQANVAGSRTAPHTREGTTIVGVRIGAADVETLGDMVFQYGATGDFALADNFLVGGSLDYWSRSSIGVEDSKVEINDLALGANTKFVFTNVSVPFRPFALAGLALHRYSVKVSERNEGDQPELDKYDQVDNDVAGRLGVDLGGGIMYRLQPQVDLAGTILYRKMTDTTIDLDQLAFTGGLSYSL